MRALLLTFLLLAPRAFGAYTLVAHGQVFSATDITLNTTGASLIVVTISIWSGSGNWTLGDYVDGNGAHNNAGCYTQAAVKLNPGHTASRIFYCLNPTWVGAAHVFYNGYGVPLFIAAYAGAPSTSVLDVVGTGNANVGPDTIQPGPITPQCSKELVVMGWSTESGSSGALNGATIVESHGMDGGNDIKGGGLGHLIQTTATIANPTLTVSAGAGNATTIVSFKAADSVCAGGGGRVQRRIIVGE